MSLNLSRSVTNMFTKLVVKYDRVGRGNRGKHSGQIAVGKIA